MTEAPGCDSVLLLGFGGPTAPGRSLEFVRKVTGGRASEERIVEVARHYDDLGGISPYNRRTEEQAEALRLRLQASGFRLPVHVGYRFWEPFLPDTVGRMRSEGCRRAAGVILSVFQCAASWDVYREMAASAAASVDLSIDYIDSLHLSPGYIGACADRIRSRALEQMGAERFRDAEVIFTAHSVPEPVALASPYAGQYAASAAAIAVELDHPHWRLAYQSAAPGRLPWLGPDVSEAIRGAAARGVRDVLIAPIGFLCDHVEVLFDLDITARASAVAAGVGFVRARTVEAHPLFIGAIADAVAAKAAPARR